MIEAYLVILLPILLVGLGAFLAAIRGYGDPPDGYA